MTGAHCQQSGRLSEDEVQGLQDLPDHLVIFRRIPCSCHNWYVSFTSTLSAGVALLRLDDL